MALTEPLRPALTALSLLPGTTLALRRERPLVLADTTRTPTRLCIAHARATIQLLERHFESLERFT